MDLSKVLERALAPERRLESVDEVSELPKGSVVVSLAPWQLWLAFRRVDYAALICAASHYILDGTLIVLAMRIAGETHARRLTGRELAQAAFQGNILDGRSTAVVGSSPGTCEALTSTHPDWVVIDAPLSDVPTEHELALVASELARSEVSTAFVALGSPKQELWTKALSSFCPDTTWLMVGGAFDVATGQVAAPGPIWLLLRLEWLQRLLQRPRALIPRTLRAASALPLVFAWAIWAAATSRHAPRGRSLNGQES